MAPTVSVSVPPELGDVVLDALLTLYQTQAEALHAATLVYLEDRRSLDAVLEHRDGLTETDALIDLVGWRFGPRIRPVELVGAPSLIRETVHATLVDVAERFARAIDRYERGEVDLDRLRAAARDSATLFRAFVGFEDAHA